RRPGGDPADVVAPTVVFQSSVRPGIDRPAGQLAFVQADGRMLDDAVAIEADDEAAVRPERQEGGPAAVMARASAVLPEDAGIVARVCPDLADQLLAR